MNTFKCKSLVTLTIALIMFLTLSVLSHAPSAAEKPPFSNPPWFTSSTISREINTTSPTVPGVVLVGLKPQVTLTSNRTGIQVSDTALGTTFSSIGVQRSEPVFATVNREVSLTKLTNAETNLRHIYRLHLEPEVDVLDAVQRLRANSAVVYAEPDYLAHIITLPNDPLYSEQWGFSQINAPGAWDVTQGSHSVVIAIIDSGIDTLHTDLVNKLWDNPGEIPGNALDDDNNGYVDDIHGWNMVDNNADLSDNTGHGTQVAGVAAADTDNGIGIAGVCWECQIMPVKVVQTGGVANYSDIAAGVIYAAQKGAEVINLSLGGYNDSATLRAAIEVASQTAVVVGGAGNDDRDAAFYPAAYDHVLAVVGTTSSDTKVGTSNYGTWVNVSAPGEAITTTFSGGTYGSTSGTSMAAPFVAGLAGLLKSQNPDWSAEMVRAQIIHTTVAIDSLNPGYIDKLGSGRIDASQALTTTAQPLLTYQSYTVNGEIDGRPELGSTVDLDVTLVNRWANVTNLQATLSTTDPYVTIITGTAPYDSIATNESGTNTTPFRFNVLASTPYARNMPFTLTVTANGIYTNDIPLTVTTASGITHIHGTLTTQTWSNDRTYIVDNDAGIAEGHVLTIEPGTEVRFDGHYSLSVAGTLIADGTETQPIRFTSNQPTPMIGDWSQIRFLDSSVDATLDKADNYTAGSILRYVIISYGEGVTMDNAAPYIAHNTFSQISGTGISGSGSQGLVVANNVFEGAHINLSVIGDSFSVVSNTVSEATLTAHGPGIIAYNRVGEASGTGISAHGSLTVTTNRVVNCDEGMIVDNGFISNNLLANNDNYGLRVMWGTPSLVSNTVAFNGGAGVYIEDGTPNLYHNNLIPKAGQYALQNATTNPITATSNWWGTSNDMEIQAILYDSSDEFGIGIVNYSGYRLSPESDAPGYVRAVSITPASPVGIQTVTFDVEFSGPMDTSSYPSLDFTRWEFRTTSNSQLVGDCIRAITIDGEGNKWIVCDASGISVLSPDGTWTSYTPSNSGLVSDRIFAMAIDAENNKWFGTDKGVSVLTQENTWLLYDTTNSGLASNEVWSVMVDHAGNKWFGLSAAQATVSVLSRAGNWSTYTPTNSALTGDMVWDIHEDSTGNKYFGTIDGSQGGGGLSVLWSDGSWALYNTSNSNLAANSVRDIAVDQLNNIWVGGRGGVSVLRSDEKWRVYNTANSEIASSYVNSIAIDSLGTKWFGTGDECLGAVCHNAGISRLGPQDNEWRKYDLEDPVDAVSDIVIDRQGAKWFGFWPDNCNEGYAVGGGIGILRGEYIVTDNSQWLSSTHYQATYDIVSLVPRGIYTVSVSEARDARGIEIPIHTQFDFTVDYAGEITDYTSPNTPWVIAGGKEENASTVEAMWNAHEPDSSITGYRYAIGSAAGATDIVNWTATSSRSVTRSGLGLIEGRQYWFTVQARNEGGLWSANGYSAFVAGQSFHRVFLPLMIRSQ